MGWNWRKQSLEDFDNEEAIHASWRLEHDNKDEENMVENDNPPYNELLHAFEEMHKDMQKLFRRNNALKSECASLS